MASVSQLVEDVANIMGEPRDSVNSYARALLDAGILPKSKGRAIAQVKAIDIVALFTAVCLQPKIKDVAKEVERYMNLKAVGGQDGPRNPEELLAGDYLRGMVEAFISPSLDQEDRAERAAYMQCEIVFVQNWPEIVIRTKDEVIFRFNEYDSTQWPYWHQRTTVLSCQAFLVLRETALRDYVDALIGRGKV